MLQSLLRAQFTLPHLQAKQSEREVITRWREDMNFMLEWQEQYLMGESLQRTSEILFLPQQSIFLLHRHTEDGIF